MVILVRNSRSNRHTQKGRRYEAAAEWTFTAKHAEHLFLAPLRNVQPPRSLPERHVRLAAPSPCQTHVFTLGAPHAAVRRRSHWPKQEVCCRRSLGAACQHLSVIADGGTRTNDAAGPRPPAHVRIHGRG